MNNYHRRGGTIDIIGATVAQKSGVPFIVGTLLAIPVTDIPVGGDGAAKIDEAFTLPKASATVIAQGALVGWDDTNKQVVAADGDLTNFGVALLGASDGSTEVAVRLLPGIGALPAGG